MEKKDINIERVISQINEKISCQVAHDSIYNELKELATILKTVPKEQIEDLIKTILKKCSQVKRLLDNLNARFANIINVDNCHLFLDSNLMQLIRVYSYKEVNKLEEKIYTLLFRNIESERRRLIGLAQNGDTHIRDLLVNINMGLVKSIVQKYANHYKGDREELEQYGVIGLIEAIKQYNVQSDNQFSTVATLYIKKNILADLNNYANFYAPTNVNWNIASVRKAWMILQSEGKEPTVEAIANKTGLTTEKVAELLLHINIDNSTVGLNDLVAPSDNDSSTYLAGVSTPPIEETYKEKFLPRDIRLAIENSRFNQKHIKILKMSYGIDTPDNRVYTLEEIAQILGSTKQNIFALREKALAILRTGPYAYELLNYIEDDELNERIIIILKSLTLKIYSPIFPDFYSFFPEYTTSEIEDAISRLPQQDKTKLANIIERCNQKENVEKKDRNKLVDIIKQIYDKLFETYGRRTFTNLVADKSMPKA